MKIDKQDIGAGLIVLLIGVPLGVIVLIYKLDKWKIIDIGSVEKFISSLFR